jgi:uroporphyrin-III C-methyltransferase
MKVGQVFLVGAGPGDPDLITVKGLRYLREADVVLYDRLIPVGLLQEARPDATLINVGKERGTEDLQQELIQELIVTFARQGRTVCRLKGGDPFVFGRINEETSALELAGISYTVVPGISSAIAGPGSAGIAVTDRKHAHAFMVIAGNRSHRFDSPEWTAAAIMARAGGTVVVMMGQGRMREIMQFLMEQDCPADMPAAAVAHATAEDARVVISNIRGLASDASALPSPAVLVIGRVVNSRHALEGLLPNVREAELNRQALTRA